MQIQAGIPAELVDVLQATILFFLVATPVLRRVFRLRGVKTGIDSPGTFTQDLWQRRGARRLMDALISALYSIPVLGLVFQFVGYLIDVLPTIAPIMLRVAAPLTPRRAVRRGVRALRRREHRHRGDHARRRLRRLGRRRRRGAAHPGRPSAVLRGDAGAGHRLAAALLSGMLIALLHAWLSISVRADQIISGTIINIAAFGLTGYLNTLISQDLADRRRRLHPVPPTAGADRRSRSSAGSSRCS